MHYRMVLIVSNEQLTAISFRENGCAEEISLEGNRCMSYKSEQLPVFCEYIKDFFSIDTFSDVELDCVILNFGMPQADLHALYAMLQGVAALYVMDAGIVLPMLLIKETAMEPNHTYVMHICDMYYEVSVDDSGNTAYKKTEKTDGAFAIDVQKLWLFHQFNCQGMMEDKRKYEEQEKRRAQEAEAWEQQMKKKTEAHAQEVQRLRDALERTKRKCEDMEKQREQWEKNRKRCIIRGVAVPNDMSFYMAISKLFSSSYANAVLEANFSDGDIVKKEEIICTATVEYDSQIKASAKATCDGHVFYLLKSGDKINLNEKTPVAIIGDLADTRAEVMEWYKRQNIN